MLRLLHRNTAQHRPAPPYLQQLVLVPDRTEPGVTEGLSHLNRLETFDLMKIIILRSEILRDLSLTLAPYWLLRQGTELHCLPR